MSDHLGVLRKIIANEEAVAAGKWPPPHISFPLDRIAALRAAVADMERMEWIERNTEHDDGDDYQLPFVCAWIGPVPKEYAENLRTAIDAARKEKGDE